MRNQNKLKSIALEASKKIISVKSNNEFFNKPYKHVVIDNFFPTSFALQISKSFPKLNDHEWEKSNDYGIEIKYRSKWESEFDVPANIIDAVRIFNSSIILKAISQTINIKKIIPDPYFTGGGLNLMGKNGLLDVHIDGNYHDATGLNRRVNIIYFISKQWKSDWGGEFEIYDNKGEKLIKKIPPLFNRLIIFDTHDKSFHGVPTKLNFPNEIFRKSLILYYYTKSKRPISQNSYKKPHSALWKSKGVKDKKGKINRGYF